MKLSFLKCNVLEYNTGGSAKTALAAFEKEIIRLLDNMESVSSVGLDLSKTFDGVNSYILRGKLQAV